jgi:AcrR family transcriptional regulator
MKDTKEHILETAFLLCLQKSFKSITLKDIVKETGLSNGAFYHYFENKEQLFRETINHFFEIANQSYKTLSKESLFQFIQDNLATKSDYKIKKKYMNKDINIFSFIFEASRYFPDIQEKNLEFQQKELNTWIEIIDIAKKSGEIKSNVASETLANFFLYTSDGNLLSLFTGGEAGQAMPKLKVLWEGLYQLLKA